MPEDGGDRRMGQRPEENNMTTEEKLAKLVDRGPKKGQSKKSLEECLVFAKRMFQERGMTFGGMLRWAPLVAAFEKALGKPVTPTYTERHEDGTTRSFDFNTVKITKKGATLRMKS
jgi:hypothetical protein